MANFNGTSGNDIFTGGSDPDTAVGNGGNDTLSGGDSYDLLVGNAGSDVLNGGADNDTLFSGDESPPYSFPYYGNPWTPPQLDTGSEVDTLNGGDGDDVIFAGYGDNVDGGTNFSYGDKLFISFMGASSGVTADFRLASQVIGGGTITGIENISWVQGSNFDDDINVGSGNGYSDRTTVFGMGGNDHLVAGYYTAILFGGEGNDIVDGRSSQYLQSVDGGAGDDILYTNTNTFASAYGGDGNDTIYSHGETYGGAGNDIIVLQSSYYGGQVFGDDGDDQITAANFSGNYMVGGAGADTLTGGSGADTLISANLVADRSAPADDMGLEHDVLNGFGGNDTIAAGYGDDVDGGSGTDTLRYSLGGAASTVTFDTAGIVSGQPYVFAGGTINSIETLTYLRGSEFADTLNLATQSQLLTVDAGAGDDVVTSHNSSVSVSGGAGDDRFISGAAGDTFDGGTGTDTIDYRAYGSAVTVSLGLAAGSTGTGAGGDQIINVENVDGSAFGDTINGSDGANILRGLAGTDTLDGKGGNDTLDGGVGADSMTGGLGNDVFYIDDAGDQVFEAAGQGNDAVYTTLSYTLAAGQSIETLAAADPGASTPLDLTGNALSQLISGNAAGNLLTSGGGNDYLVGLGGDDVLVGNAGAASTLEGGTGEDNYYVNRTGDSVIEAVGQGNDRVYASVSFTLGAGQEVEMLNAADPSATTSIGLAGNALGQVISGNAGANVLIGGGGSDYLVGAGGDDILVGNTDAASTLQGGTGNDWYYVSRTGDSLIEFAGEGNDRILTSVSYTLSAGQEIETLSALDPASTTALGLTGNALAQVINGNAGANVLVGGGGNDYLVGLGGDDIIVGNADANSTLQGGTGNDWYYVSRTGDSLVEFAGEGNDRILTSVSYTLSAGQEVETLSAADQNGTAAIDLIGNDYGQVIFGTNGANGMSGFGGADQLAGFGGEDVLLGGDGDDQLNGGAGHDVLNGGNGADLFVFADAIGGGNVDTIQDLASGTDRIALDHSIFTGLSTGALSAGAFVVGNAALDADDRIIYNQAAGQIWFDADGNGAGDPVLFATLGNQPTITAGDFVVI